MSGGFFEEPPARAARPARPTAPPQRSRALLATAVVLVVGFFLISVFTGVWTDRLWFRSVNYSTVFTTMLGTRVVLFVAFGAIMGVFVGVNVYLAYRFRPVFRPASSEQAQLDRYREFVTPIRRWLLVGISLLIGLFAGASGSGKWRDFLLWRNSTPFGTTDPYFNRDIGFYVFELPWLHYLVGFAMAAIVLAVLASSVVHYLFGGIRLQARHDRLSDAAQVQLSVLLGLFLLFKAADYWLDRFDLTTDTSGRHTGMTYTIENAVLPSKNILMFIALLCAVLLFANVFRRTWMLPAVGLALLALSAILLGVLWPGIVQQFTVKPSEPDKEGPYIARNIEGTRAAYDINDAEVTQYDANVSLSPEQLKADAESIPGIRLLDPALVSSTFENLQQVRGYYSVPKVLDVDRYTINGETRDTVVAVRELDQSGPQSQQRNWANDHTVYTHGFGVIAAYGNQRNGDGELVANDGEPAWAEQNIPPQGELSESGEGYEPRIYFGEQSPQYSVVGSTDGRDVELDIPEEVDSGSPQNNTYDGAAGVPVGSLFNKLLYAVKYSEPNLVLSNRVNDSSRIIYERNPKDRVEKVAPWLSVDNDSYPAVVDGRVVWILDAYTTTDRYPMSEKRSLSAMTTDSLNTNTAFATLPTDEINYMRNSVKAVVDAYDGTVTLYEWDQEDPILKAWMGAFDGVVKPRETIPDALLEHMRYPQDLFKVQRFMLAEYHVTEAQAFYNGTDRWKVPEDPEIGNQSQPPYRLSVKTPTGGDEPQFSLTSVFVPTARQNLASFISVNSEASSDDYGKIRILRLPGNTQIQGPSQIANTFAADEAIQQALLPFRNNSEVQLGNLLTLPVGDGLLYVQPVYTLRQTGEASYPVLRYVLASFGKEAGFGPTLNSALDDVLGTRGTENSLVEPGEPGDPGPTDPEPPDPGGGEPGASADVQALLEEADATFEEAEQALREGDFAAYGELEQEARDLLAQALELAARESNANNNNDSGGGGGNDNNNASGGGSGG